jgi:hypothetical protein
MKYEFIDWRKIVAASVFASFSYSSHAEVRDTISTQMTIVPTGNVSNIIVVSGGSLTLQSIESIVIDNNFDVVIGGQLNVGNPNTAAIIFHYDASGNRVAKEPEE